MRISALKKRSITAFTGRPESLSPVHAGPYDDEPATVARMHEYMETQGYVLDITSQRMHHEIYLSDARKVAPEKLKTVIRHPIRKG
jgi:hypothetical protein